MRLDKYNNPIYNSQDIFNLLYQGKVDCLTDILVDSDSEIKKFEHATSILLNDFSPEIWSIEKNDSYNQKNWFMPKEYKEMDIEKYILELSPPWDPHYSRVLEELEEYKNRNMLDLLRWLKYFVDTCKQNNIVWGVGRGSSVASYILFLLEVHCIDSVKFNLDWHEFMR